MPICEDCRKEFSIEDMIPVMVDEINGDTVYICGCIYNKEPKS